MNDIRIEKHSQKRHLQEIEETQKQCKAFYYVKLNSTNTRRRLYFGQRYSNFDHLYCAATSRFLNIFDFFNQNKFIKKNYKVITECLILYYFF